MAATSSITHYSCFLDESTLNNTIHLDKEFYSLFDRSGLDKQIILTYTAWLEHSEPTLLKQIHSYYSDSKMCSFTPLFIYHEASNKLITILADRKTQPEQPGEMGSILAYVRFNEYDDKLLCSDCFGQLSCSSCAVELLAGTPANSTPREEEYDMLDIDEERPPTQLTRLSCQAVVGNDALIIKVRK
jgi:ferredoxin